jgi:hypothetical protein
MRFRVLLCFAAPQNFKRIVGLRVGLKCVQGRSASSDGSFSPVKCAELASQNEEEQMGRMILWSHARWLFCRL